MNSFSPETYGPIVAELIRDNDLPDLGPGRENMAVRDQLQALVPTKLFAEQTPIRDEQMARCCLSGLWLRHNFLDESHTISQEIHTSSGSYWHGMMHRREPDYSNAKYWFHKVGSHPVFPKLCQVAHELAQSLPSNTDCNFLANQDAWDPFAFIDLCQKLAKSPDADSLMLCQSIAAAEWNVLFDYCYQHAMSP